VIMERATIVDLIEAAKDKCQLDLTSKHFLQDQCTVQEIVDAVVFMLARLDKESVVRACRFLQIVESYEKGPTSFVRNLLDDSVLLQRMESLLESPDYCVRTMVVETLGEVASIKSVPALLCKFNACLNNDPLLVCELLSQIMWLDRNMSASILKAVILSECYLSRWCALDWCDCSRFDMDYNLKKSIISCLTHDSSAIVAAEAEWMLKRLELNEQITHLQLEDRCKFRKTLWRPIKAMEPKIRIHTVFLAFRNYLVSINARDYSRDQFEQYVAKEFGSPVCRKN